MKGLKRKMTVLLSKENGVSHGDRLGMEVPMPGKVLHKGKPPAVIPKSAITFAKKKKSYEMHEEVSIKNQAFSEIREWVRRKKNTRNNQNECVSGVVGAGKPNSIGSTERVG